MKVSLRLASIVICCAAFVLSCKKDKDNKIQGDPDKFAILTRVHVNSDYVQKTWYVGTFSNLDVGDYTNDKAWKHAKDRLPFIELYGDYVFVMPNNPDYLMKKYKRQPDGSLSDEGSLTIPSGTEAIDMVIESDTRGYISLQQLGKIAVFNPSTMQIKSYIDLTSYTKGGDGSPDPANLIIRNNKLYVACLQRMEMWPSSAFPAHVLIIDLANGNAITSVTDSRSTFAGSMHDQGALFFDETGDLYVSCQASYGSQTNQKCGFLRIKNGQTNFDPTYFFNVADYLVVTIPGGRIRNFHHMQYVGNGILYSTGNVYTLSALGDYANKTMASFKVDVINKVITKLELPYSNGYAGSVLAYQNKIYWGLASAAGVGIYSYDPATNDASTHPVITTQGDPFSFKAFE